MLMLPFLAMLLQPQADAASAPLKPVGKWNVDYGEGQCLLARKFGSADEALVVGFRPDILGGRVAILLEAPDTARSKPLSGTATLQIQPGNRVVTLNYSMSPDTGKDRRRLELYVQEDMSSLSSAEQMSIMLGKSPLVALDLQGLPAGVKALNDCQKALLESMQINPRDIGAIAEEAKLRTDLTDVYTSGQFPPRTLPREPGRVIMLLTVGADGGVKACRITESSTIPLVDSTTCALTIARVRYEPARDKSGQPLASHARLGVRWMSGY